MHKADLCRMQALPFYSGIWFSIDIVPQYRMPQISQVHTDLVGSAGFQPKPQMGCLLIFCQHVIMRHSWLCILFRNAHLFPIHRMPANRSRNRSLRLAKTSHCNSLVLSCERMHLNLRRERLMRCIIFGHHQQAAGKAVNPMHDARTNHAVNAGKPVTTVVQQCMHQCPGRMPRRRMHHHPLWLIHHKEVIILIHNIQGNVFRNQFQWFRFRNRPLHHFSAFQPIIFGNLLLIYDEISVFYLLLQHRAGNVQRLLRCQPFVQTCTRSIRRNQPLFCLRHLWNPPMLMTLLTAVPHFSPSPDGVPGKTDSRQTKLHRLPHSSLQN
jgi:hypothetical protein